MDRNVTRKDALMLATMLATIGGFIGAIYQPDTMMVPAFGLFAAWVVCLFSPDSWVL